MQQPSSTKMSLQAVTPGHLIKSTIVTALITAGDAGFQYFQSNGAHFSFVELIGAVLVALLATLGTGVITLEKNPTIDQAIDGALMPHVTALAQIVSQHASLLNQFGSTLSYTVNMLEHQAAKQPVAPLQSQQTPVPVVAPQTPMPAVQPTLAPVQSQFRPLSMPGMTQYAPLPDVSMPLAAMPASQSGQVPQR